MADVYCWGWNRFGQAPTHIAVNSPVLHVSALSTATFVVTGDGRVLLFGRAIGLVPPTPPTAVCSDGVVNASTVADADSATTAKRRRLQLPPPRARAAAGPCTDPGPGQAAAPAGEGESADAAASRAHVFAPLLPYRVMSIACGWQHAVAVTAEGGAVSFGRNACGQLGVGPPKAARNAEADADADAVTAPAFVEALRHERVVAACCGDAHTLWLTARGVVYSAGRRDNPALGLGLGLGPVASPAAAASASTPAPECVWTPRPVALRVDGGADAKATAVNAGELAGTQRVVYVSASSCHSALVTGDGNAWTFGSGLSGALGHGDSHTHDSPTRVDALSGLFVSRVCCAPSATLFVTKTGLYACGINTFGQLGLPAPTPAPTAPSAAAATHAPPSAAHDDSDSDGDGGAAKAKPVAQCFTPDCVDLPDDAVAVAVACGSQHAVALARVDSASAAASGSGAQYHVLAWGNGARGQTAQSITASAASTATNGVSTGTSAALTAPAVVPLPRTTAASAGAAQCVLIGAAQWHTVCVVNR